MSTVDTIAIVGVGLIGGSLDIRFAGESVEVEGLNLTDEIRTEDAGVNASKVAQMPAVRTAVLALQRSFRQPPGLVADGRDMGKGSFTRATGAIYTDHRNSNIHSRVRLSFFSHFAGPWLAGATLRHASKPRRRTDHRHYAVHRSYATVAR